MYSKSCIDIMGGASQASCSRVGKDPKDNLEQTTFLRHRPVRGLKSLPYSSQVVSFTVPLFLNLQGGKIACISAYNMKAI